MRETRAAPPLEERYPCRPPPDSSPAAGDCLDVSTRRDKVARCSRTASRQTPQQPCVTDQYRPAPKCATALPLPLPNKPSSVNSCTPVTVKPFALNDP